MLKMLKSYIALTCFYKKYIYRYAHIVAPLRELLKKNVKLRCEEKHQRAFDLLRTALTRNPITLTYPNFKHEFVLTTDASKIAGGYIISNRDPITKQLHVIQYGSRLWTDAESKYGASQLELACILHAVECNSQFFMFKPFSIITDSI